MKARIENGTIRKYGSLPQDFENILNFSQADETTINSKGFYDVVTPEYDPAYWRLGEIYFDDMNQVFSYRLIAIPVDEVKQKLKTDFEAAKDRTRKELLDALVDKMIELHRTELPEGLVQLWDILKAENIRVGNTIEEMATNDPDALRKFRIRSEDINSFIENIRKFKH